VYCSPLEVITAVWINDHLQPKEGDGDACPGAPVPRQMTMYLARSASHFMMLEAPGMLLRHKESSI
jgi:hypothetical protein